MRSFLHALAATLVATVQLPQSARAVSLQVSPLLVEVPATANASALNVVNNGTSVLQVQARVFRWSQSAGEDVLQPTDDVVVSPPFLRLQPGATNVIRVVRTSRAQRISEESYRVVVDELPDAQRLRGGNVALVLRQSIPAFFLGEKATAPQLSWTAKAVKGQLLLQADNQGGRRVRISRLRANDASGSVLFGTGLVGYVLAGSQARFARPGASLKGPSITISADGDAGALQARVTLDR